MIYLLDVSALVALGFMNHEFHGRLAAWVAVERLKRCENIRWQRIHHRGGPELILRRRRGPISCCHRGDRESEIHF
jgi:hypothetical protein